METSEIVEAGTILRVTVGSTVHRLRHGGQDDRDEMAVYIEPPEGLVDRFLVEACRRRGLVAGRNAPPPSRPGGGARSTQRRGCGGTR